MGETVGTVHYQVYGRDAGRSAIGQVVLAKGERHRERSDDRESREYTLGGPFAEHQQQHVYKDCIGSPERAGGQKRAVLVAFNQFLVQLPDEPDLLHALQDRTETTGAFHVISGYRSPKSNTMLRGKGGGGVAKRSLHMKGMAIDIRLPGHDTRDLHRAAKSLKRGGVGYYRKSDFVHVDVGRVRYW